MKLQFNAISYFQSKNNFSNKSSFVPPFLKKFLIVWYGISLANNNFISQYENSLSNKLPRRKQRGIILSALLKKIYLTFIYFVIIFSLISNVAFDLFLITIFPNSTYEITVHSKNFHPIISFSLLDIF